MVHENADLTAIKGEDRPCIIASRVKLALSQGIFHPGSFWEKPHGASALEIW